jgi:cell fate regulator YaaT (PSP1 superfamily)
MNVFDWLGGLVLSDSDRPFPIIEVSFKRGSRKDFFRNSSGLLLEKGDWVTVEGAGGFDVGQVSLQGELVKLQMKKHNVADTPDIRKVLRRTTDTEMEQYHAQKEREQEVMVRSRAMARSLNLDMKIAEVELQADGRKGTFYYTADQRVDFRELIKRYAADFHIKVEMRQIGARQESGKVGGIGSCGRELCCATWLTDFKSVNTAAARYQNLSINQTKLSGQCGRLKCCLNYELDTYMDALRAFPTEADSIETAQGRATLQKRDIFRNLMWYSYSGSNKQYPLSIERVIEIKALNKDGVKPEELGAAEVVERRPGTRNDAEADQGFVNDVGQISLRALDRKAKARKKKTQTDARKEDEGQSRPEARQQQKKGGNKGAVKGEGANAQRKEASKSQQKAQPKAEDGAQGHAEDATPKAEGQRKRHNRHSNKNRGQKPKQTGDGGGEA